MNRRIFLRNTGLVAGASLLFQKQGMASFFNTAEFNITMLRNNVGIFTERGGTIGFLLSENGIVVVDAQFPQQASHFIEEARKRSTAPIRYLINTHHHGDHSSGNISFKGIAGNVVAHENSLANQQRVAESQKTMDKTLLPDTTFKDDWKVDIGKEKIKLNYYGPAHTNGDSVIHFEEANITHMGDLMFNRKHPFIDRTSGASIRNWIRVLEKVAGKFDKETIYIFGHSLVPGKETGTAEDLKSFGDYLQKLLNFAETEFKSGKSKEEFLKNTSIPGATEWTGDGIQRPLTAAYEEAAEKK